MNNNFLLVGTVSNVGKYLKSDLNTIKKAINKIGTLEIYLVESDSSDGTIDLLNELQKSDSNFNFKSFGNLRSKLDDRIDRIRFCRNAYVEFIRDNNSVKKWDYVFVADLDGMNSALNSKKILGAISKHHLWDACFSNQSLGYYDLYALRASGWVESDCFSELRDMQRDNKYVGKFSNSFLNFLTAFWHFDSLRKKVIYSKMKRLRGNLVSVNSAFGGFAIYKTEIFCNFDYTKRGSSAGCEHLDLHARCIESGLRLAIDPNLINSHWNEYNVNKFLIIRFLKELKKFIHNETS
jgi:hypothetical protein